MYENNYASIFRREVLVRIARLMVTDAPAERFNRIPFEMIHADDEPYRCCIYCDREVIRARVIAALGYSLETEFDQGRSLAEYALEAMFRRDLKAPFLTMLELACHSCVRSRFFVTNACQGCVARPCVHNCPKQAISVQRKQAVIDNDKCISCGKCVKVCPYSAVIKQPVPCEQACPFDAISRCEETGKERIDFTKCVACGKCISACPFGAMMEKSQMVDVLKLLLDRRKYREKTAPLIACFAPALAGEFPNATPGKWIVALKHLGFDEVLEVASGADECSVNEANEFVERMQEGEKLMTSSCCPAYYEAVRKHIPEILHAVSHTPSPMIFSARQARKRFPDARVIFIGPCLAKRKEGFESGEVDYVLTMEELGAIFAAENIQFDKIQEEPVAENPSVFGRSYAISGGVAQAVKKEIADRVPCQCGSINGINKQTVKLLKLYGLGKISNVNLLEVMACEGGCVAGPCVVADPAFASAQIRKQNPIPPPETPAS